LYRGRLAYRDSRYDERFTSLPTFATVVAELDSLPAIFAQFGPGESGRVALQFIYTFLGSIENPVFEAGAFDKTVVALLRELSVPEWTYIGISNVQNFESASALLDLTDGITFRHRSPTELGPILAWGDREFERLYEDWEQGAFGSHVMLSEHKVPKSPGNLVLIDTSNPWTKAQRALLALRLLKSGDVRIGRMFISRPAGFNFGVGRADTSTGFTVWHPGSNYSLEPPEISSVREIYTKLVSLEQTQNAPRNLGVALRSFTSIYDRYGYQSEDRILDAITALEALLRIDTELSFKLAFRAAGILANNEDERVSLFKQMKSYYSTRNHIVHGHWLGPQDLALIQDDEPLRDVTRRLLVAFLHFVLSSGRSLNDAFYEELDSLLQHSRARSGLRESMGLV
jgi:hypothetical protein